MKYLGLFALCIFLIGCNNSGKIIPAKPNNAVDIIRFDVGLHSYLIQTDSAESSIVKNNRPLLSVLGLITINDSNVYNPNFRLTLKNYFSNKELSKVYDDELNIFADLSPYEKELSDANLLIEKKLNGAHLPPLAIHVSGFGTNTIILENMISLSADKYLGKDYPLYRKFFKEYQLIQMQPKMITRDYLKTWIIADLPNELKQTTPEKKTLLVEMINQGKTMYALSQFLPHWRAEDLMGYSSEQLKWCETNEKTIWTSILDQNQLYSTDDLLIKEYTEDAPFTAPISPQSPGRLGIWMGWQIVSAYTSKTGISLSQLLKTQAQTIIKGSGFSTN